MESSYEVSSILSKFDISSDDIELIREAGLAIGDGISAFIEDLYSWLQNQQEFHAFFDGNSRLLERVKDSQHHHWKTFMEAQVDEAYFASRRHVGAIHEHIQLPNDIYCATMSKAQMILIKQLNAIRPVPARISEMIFAVNKLANLDTYLSLDEISRIQREKILAHSKSSPTAHREAETAKAHRG